MKQIKAPPPQKKNNRPVSSHACTYAPTCASLPDGDLTRREGVRLFVASMHVMLV